MTSIRMEMPMKHTYMHTLTHTHANAHIYPAMSALHICYSVYLHFPSTTKIFYLDFISEHFKQCEISYYTVFSDLCSAHCCPILVYVFSHCKYPYWYPTFTVFSFLEMVIYPTRLFSTTQKSILCCPMPHFPKGKA